MKIIDPQGKKVFKKCASRKKKNVMTVRRNKQPNIRWWQFNDKQKKSKMIPKAKHISKIYKKKINKKAKIL